MDFLKDWGLIAGIAGIGMGVFLVLFRELIRKKIFPVLTKKQSFIIIIIFMLLVWSIAGYCIYTYQILNSSPVAVKSEDTSLNKAFLLGLQSAVALAKTNQSEDAKVELIKINEWLKDLSISFRVESDNFQEADLQNIVNYISPKGDAILYSYLIGFYSVVCDNTPSQCHQEFDLKDWLSKSMLKTTGYKGNTTTLDKFLTEMETHCMLKIKLSKV